jgi:hypothetical protein
MITPTKENTEIMAQCLKTKFGVKVIGLIRISASEYFDESLTDDQIMFCMRNRIWHLIYGDLIEPMRRLEVLARHNHPHQTVVEDVMKELNNLLATPK